MTDIMDRRAAGFVLWRPARTTPAPAVRVVTFVPGNPPGEALVLERALSRVAGFDDLWALPLAGLPLVAGSVYHYWFLVENDHPDGPRGVVRVTDPFARVVDYRLRGAPAGVVKLENGALVDCDPDGSVGVTALAANPSAHAPNNQLVVYEVPSSWTRGGTEDGVERDVGTFRDVLALLTAEAPGGNFADVPEVAARAHALELGVNALELLPPADSPFKREWGYGTGNYSAADYDLGFPEGNASPTAEQDLRRLVARMHALGIRFFADMVMAFGYSSYRQLSFADFYIDPTRELDNPDAYQSSRNGELRDGFGGTLWRYLSAVDCYDPVSGTRGSFVPARRFMLAYLLRWLGELGADGLRLDSVNNIGSWDFLAEFRDAARAEYGRLHAAHADMDPRFLVVGEELSVPLGLLTSGRLDSLWNEAYKRRLRAVIRGRSLAEESFEETVRRLIDCRNVGFRDGPEAVNYVTSHDVGGFENERLFLFLQNNGIGLKLERFKLAFACLLTSVGTPMILAGEEFADEHDRAVTDADKQQDPLNFARVSDPWRRELFDYVARLVRFRIDSRALGVNDTRFIHTDFTAGRRILAWLRGVPGREDPVVVVANFSGVTPPGGEYRVRDWPNTPPGRRWREVSQARDVPDDWVGREPLFPWEAKVYALV
jgi:1,4-alpha-glucan branching enzyme